jgi:ABC-type polysaccharide/polyol phosphate transport system ATPase subunit
MNIVEFKDVWEKYRIKFIDEGKVSWEEVWALEGIDFSLEPGEVLGVIGHNGAGKTTLLKLIAGMLMPDKGEVAVSGKVSTLMELGAGFNPEFTGRENIAINARIYGLAEKDLEERLDEIAQFAGLGRFINAPIKYYSQGMYMRLAFALAIYVEPDILLIDDILAVGDEEAQRKCVAKILELKQAGKTIVIVSHDMHMIARLCSRVLLLENGRIIATGLPQSVIPRYLEQLGDKNGIGVLARQNLRAVFNNGRLVITYSGVGITKGMGGYVSFLTQLTPGLDTRFCSFNLEWRIIKLSVDEIVAEGLSQDKEVALVWTMKVLKDSLQLQVKVKSSALRQPRLDLLLDSDYKKWLTLESEGEFPAFSHKTNWQDLDLYACPEAELALTGEGETAVPVLFFKLGAKETQVKLFNSGYEQEARIIQAYASENPVSLEIKVFARTEEFQDYFTGAKERFLMKQEQELARRRELHSIFSGDLRLFADAPAKAIRIYFKDREITRLSGLHISFLLNKVWYDLTCADWQVERKGENLALNISWQQLGIVQAWEIFFREGVLFWRVYSEARQLYEFEVFKAGLILSPLYRTFFCGCQQAEFPAEFSRWQDMPLENPDARLFGVRRENNLPAVVFEAPQNLSRLIQNSDNQACCRALQLNLIKQAALQKNFSFSTSFAFPQDDSLIGVYIDEEREKKNLRQQEELKSWRDLFTICSGDFRLFADSGQKVLRLYFKGREITAGEGLCSTFNTREIRLFMKEAQWRVEKASQQQLILALEYPLSSLSQIWRLAFSQSNALDIKIEIETKNELVLTGQEIRLELKDEFKNWFTAQEQGDFNASRYVNEIAPIRLKESKISRVVLKSDRDELPRELLFESCGQSGIRTLGICRQRSRGEEYACLNFSLPISRAEGLIAPGRHLCFEGRIMLEKAGAIEPPPAKKQTLELSRDNLKFIWDDGKGRVFWQGKELTSGLGVFTSVRSSGIWHDSSRAVWRIGQRSNDKMMVSGCWPYVPISQIWQVEIQDTGSIILKIGLEVHEEVSLEVGQANIMVIPEYKAWQVPSGISGVFVDEFTDDYDILPYRFWCGKPAEGVIAAQDEKLPGILFLNKIAGGDFRGIIENTDSLYKARLLQYQRAYMAKISPGEYTYFEGEIKIVDRL